MNETAHTNQHTVCWNGTSLDHTSSESRELSVTARTAPSKSLHVLITLTGYRSPIGLFGATSKATPDVKTGKYCASDRMCDAPINKWWDVQALYSTEAQSKKPKSYYKSSSVCLFICLSVCSLSPPRSFDRSSPNLVGVCRWTSELPLRGSFSKRSTGRRVNGSLSLSTILYICQPHSTQLQKATLLLQHLIRLKGTFCCIDGWWVYVGASRNCFLNG